jgi:hypothetical protein
MSGHQVCSLCSYVNGRNPGAGLQVRYETSKRFSTAALEAASHAGQQAAADRAYQAMVQDPNRSTGIHPMMRYIAEAAPQQGEATVRSGLEREVWTHFSFLFPFSPFGWNSTLAFPHLLEVGRGE